MVQCRSEKVPWAQLGSVPISFKKIAMFLYCTSRSQLKLNIFALGSKTSRRKVCDHLLDSFSMSLDSADTQKENDEVFELWKAEKGPTFMPQSHGQWFHDHVHSTGLSVNRFSIKKQGTE
jgi:hypothetical protein